MKELGSFFIITSKRIYARKTAWTYLTVFAGKVKEAPGMEVRKELH